MLTLYVLEGFLERLAESGSGAQFVLKGGVLLAAYDVRRPTRDIDLQAQALDATPGVILEVVRSIAALPRDDGLEYDLETAKAETIRDEEEYSGVRITMSVQLATARLTFSVDLNVGGPVWPAPSRVEIPRLLGGTIAVRGYPISMVLAEKIVTALQRGVVNTRWRDFADVLLLSSRHAIQGSELEESLRVVAAHRGTPLQALSAVLTNYAELADTRWRAWVRKQRLTETLPSGFGEVLESVMRVADPSLRGETKDRVWEPKLLRWERAS